MKQWPWPDSEEKRKSRKEKYIVIFMILANVLGFVMGMSFEYRKGLTVYIENDGIRFSREVRMIDRTGTFTNKREVMMKALKFPFKDVEFKER